MRFGAGRDSNPRPRPWQGNDPAAAGCRASQWASSVAASASALANSEPSRSSSALVLIAGVHLRGGAGASSRQPLRRGRQGKTASARAAEYCARANGLETFMRSLVCATRRQTRCLALLRPRRLSRSAISSRGRISLQLRPSIIAFARQRSRLLRVLLGIVAADLGLGVGLGPPVRRWRPHPCWRQLEPTQLRPGEHEHASASCSKTKPRGSVQNCSLSKTVRCQFQNRPDALASVFWYPHHPGCARSRRLIRPGTLVLG